MKRLISLLLGVLFILLAFSSCGEKNNTASYKKPDDLKRLLDSTIYYRSINLDKAFQFTDSAIIQSRGRDTLCLAEAYLNKANLYYLCSRFDSAKYYNDKFDALFKNDPKMSWKNNKPNFSMADTLYLKWLRDIQQMDIDIRLHDFTSVYYILRKFPMLHKYKKEVEDSWDAIKRDKYGKFYNSKEWIRVKAYYNIQYAVYNYHFDIKNDIESNIINTFDAICQLSRISQEELDALKEYDKSIYYEYYYSLSSGYLEFASLIKGDSINNYININSVLTKFYNEGDTLNFMDSVEKTYLKNYVDSIDSDSINKNTLVQHYFDKSCKIYQECYNSLNNGDSIYLYWKANFMQNIAGIISDTNSENIARVYFDYNVKELLLASDFLFEEWGGNNIDYYQQGGANYFLAKYYNNINDSASAKHYEDKLESFIYSARKHRAFSATLVELLFDINPEKEKEEKWENYSRTVVDSKLKTTIGEIQKLDKQLASQIYKDKYFDFGIKFGKPTVWRLVWFPIRKLYLLILLVVAIVIATIIIIRKIDQIKNAEKNAIKIKQNADNLMDCVFTYLQYRKNPNLIEHLTKKIAEGLFEDIKKIEIKKKYIKGIEVGILYLSKDKGGNIEKLEGVYYDEDREIGRYVIKNEDHPAFKICHNTLSETETNNVKIKNNSVLISNFSEENREQINKEGNFTIDKLDESSPNYSPLDEEIHSILYIPLKDKQSKEILGVISFQTINESFKEIELENCWRLADFIAASIKGEFDDLRILKDSLKDISKIDYKNLLKGKNGNDSKNGIQTLFNIVYKFMFNVDADLDQTKKDLFSIALWLEEDKNEQDIKKIQDEISKEDSYISPILKTAEYIDKENKILVEYSFERYEEDGEIKNLDPSKQRHPTYLHDYSSRPALYCFAKSKADIKNKKKINVLNFYDWKLGISGEDKEKDNKIIEEIKKGEIIPEYYKYIDRLEEESKQENYKNLIIHKYIKKLDPDIFYNTSSNNGLPTNSLMFYPIIVGNEIKGVLSFQHKKRFYFNESHRIILKIIATLIGISIEKENQKNNFFNTVGNIVTHRCNTYADALIRDTEMLQKMRYRDTYFNFIDISNCDLKDTANENVKRFFDSINDGTFLNKFVYQTFSDVIAKERLARIEKASIEYQKAAWFFDRDKIEKKTDFLLHSFIKRQIDRVKNRIKIKYEDSEGCNKNIEKWDRINFDYSTISTDLKIHTSELVLEEIIYNMIINTFEHGFDPKVKVENEKIDVNIEYGKTSTGIEILYSNTGVHVGAENNSLDWIFDFERSSKKQGGLKGIGLFGVKYLLNNYLNGDITVKNEEENKKVLFKININHKN